MPKREQNCKIPSLFIASGQVKAGPPDLNNE